MKKGRIWLRIKQLPSTCPKLDQPKSVLFFMATHIPGTGGMKSLGNRDSILFQQK